MMLAILALLSILAPISCGMIISKEIEELQLVQHGNMGQPLNTFASICEGTRIHKLFLESAINIAGPWGMYPQTYPNSEFPGPEGQFFYLAYVGVWPISCHKWSKRNVPKTVSKVAAPLSKRSWLAGWALRPLGSYEVHSFLLPTQIATTKRKALPLCGGQTLWTKNALIHWYRYIAHIFVVKYDWQSGSPMNKSLLLPVPDLGVFPSPPRQVRYVKGSVQIGPQPWQGPGLQQGFLGLPFRLTS